MTANNHSSPASSADGVAWDLGDLYLGTDDPRIDSDLDSAEARAHEFVVRYRGKLASLSAAELAEAVAELEGISRACGRGGDLRSASPRGEERRPGTRQAGGPHDRAKFGDQKYAGVLRAGMGGPGRRDSRCADGRSGAAAVPAFPGNGAPVQAAPSERAGGDAAGAQVEHRLASVLAPVRRGDRKACLRRRNRRRNPAAQRIGDAGAAVRPGPQDPPGGGQGDDGKPAGAESPAHLRDEHSGPRPQDRRRATVVPDSNGVPESGQRDQQPFGRSADRELRIGLSDGAALLPSQKAPAGV